MGKIVVTEFISLDGVFEDPGGAEGYQHGGWTFTFDQGEEGGKFKLDELMAADAQLLGRVTYQGFAKAPRHRQAFVRRRGADQATARRRHQHRSRRRDHPALHARQGLTGPAHPDPSG
jgi:hypothetical protein